MTSFLEWSAAYLIVSLLLHGMMALQNFTGSRLFRREFPDGTTPSELDDEDYQRWTSLFEAHFGKGLWRFFTVIYLFYHYPGILLNAMRRGDSVSTATMFFASLGVWISIIALITQPWRG